MSNHIPPNWQAKKLGDLCNISIGKTPSRADMSYWDKNKETNNIWLSIADLSNTIDKKVYSSKEFLSSKGANIVPIVENGTLLLSFKLTIGRVAFAGVSLRTNEAIAQLPIKNANILDKNYLYYYLQVYDYDELLHGDIKVKGKSLNKAKLKQLIVKFPPLPEQKRIVEKLDKIFANIDKAKENTKKNLQNAKEVFNSRLQHLFSIGIQNAIFVKLIDLVDITSSKRIFKHEYVPRGVPFYRTKEIKELAHNKPITLELFISENKYKEIKMKFGVPSKNDLLISAVGTIGEMYIVPNEQPFYFKDGNILWIKNYKKDLLPEFLKYALQSYITKIQALAQGTAYNALTIEKLTQYKIPYIDIFAQRTLVSSLDSIFAQTHELEQIYTRKLADLDELKQSILQQVFSGKL